MVSFLDDINIDYEDWEVFEGVYRFIMVEFFKVIGNFNREYEIGVGGFGKVFFGILVDGKMVVIKRVLIISL